MLLKRQYEDRDTDGETITFAFRTPAGERVQGKFSLDTAIKVSDHVSCLARFRTRCVTE